MNLAHLEIDDPRWRKALSRLRHDFYDLPEYVRLEGESIGAQPRAFIATAGDKELFIPYLLRRCDLLFPEAPTAVKVYDVVSPYGYPGLLLSDAARESPDFAREAMDGLCKTLREQRVCSAFFRLNPLLSNGISALFPAKFFSPASKTVAIDLAQDEAAIWKGLRSGHQWVINKCRKLGFVPRMAQLRDEIDSFMGIYQETMNRVNARDAYYFSRDYFARLADMPEHVHCCVVEFEGEQAAACLFFECDGIVQAHLGGTRSKFMNKSPFHLVLHHVALWAKSRGNRYLHLGGGVGGSDDGLLEFKRGFSELTFSFLNLRLIIDEDKYRNLAALSAHPAKIPVEDVLRRDYFPVYRATR